MQNPEPKYLVNCQDGANNIERATVAFVLAATASKTNEAVVFVTSEAAELCRRGGSDGLTAHGMEPLQDLMEQFISNGGKIWLCPVCAKVHNISESELIPGAEIAGAPRTMAFLASGGMVLA